MRRLLQRGEASAFALVCPGRKQNAIFFCFKYTKPNCTQRYRCALDSMWYHQSPGGCVMHPKKEKRHLATGPGHEAGARAPAQRKPCSVEPTAATSQIPLCFPSSSPGWGEAQDTWCPSDPPLHPCICAGCYGYGQIGAFCRVGGGGGQDRDDRGCKRNGLCRREDPHPVLGSPAPRSRPTPATGALQICMELTR